jgi:hypothetical protein
VGHSRQRAPRPLVGDDLPLTKGFAQEGASETVPLSLAILAVAVSPSTGTPFVLGYIATCFAIRIGVVNLFGQWFVGFIDGVIRTHCSCHWSWSPVKDLGTPKVRPMREGQRYTTEEDVRQNHNRTRECIRQGALGSLDQIDDFNLQGVRDEFKGLDRNIRFATLYLAHMRSMESSAFCEDVLRPFPFQPQCPDISPDPLLNILHIKQCRSSLPKTILVITRVLVCGLEDVCRAGICSLSGIRRSAPITLGEGVHSSAF